MIFLPESPRWLSKAGRTEESQKVIALIYKSDFIKDANRVLEEEVATLNEMTKLTES